VTQLLVSSRERREFWWRSLRWQLAVFILLAAILSTTDLDERIASALFFDPATGWIGGSSWWTHQFIHTGGQWLIRGVVFAALCMFVASFVDESRAGWRRPAGFVAISMILSVGSVGLLKHMTNVNCPWDLIPFGGRYPYLHLFAHRSASTHVGHCFPAAHASSGYALLTLYFVAREHRGRWARVALATGICMGVIFGISQQSRGAHFLSHDLWSAMIAWCVPLSLYCFGFGCSLSSKAQARALLPIPRVAVPDTNS
jgi:membrane-associated PAP2 superfamily phosphatase